MQITPAMSQTYLELSSFHTKLAVRVMNSLFVRLCIHPSRSCQEKKYATKMQAGPRCSSGGALEMLKTFASLSFSLAAWGER